MPTIEPENECPLCIKKLVEQGEPPAELVVLPNRTRNKELAVRVCPNCDLGVARIAMSNVD